jgi:hypothetical protein
LFRYIIFDIKGISVRILGIKFKQEGWMKFKIFLFIMILSMGFALISCQGTQEQAEQVEQEEPVPVMDIAQVRLAIEAANAEFGEAIRMADAAALAGLYTEDARLLPPNSEMIEGRKPSKPSGAEVFRWESRMVF